MKKTYLQQLKAIGIRAKNHSFWQPASTILAQRPQAIIRHTGTAY